MTGPQRSLFDEARFAAEATSRAARESIREHLTPLQTRVLAAFWKYGPMIDEELLAVAELNDLTASTVRTRRHELGPLPDGRGRLIALGKRKNTRGLECVIWGLSSGKRAREEDLPRANELLSGEYERNRDEHREIASPALPQHKLIEIPAGAWAVRCTSCQKVCYWGKTESGHATKLDPEFPGGMPPTKTDNGLGVYHFVTCPTRDLHRKPK